ncbi:MAG: hypothetical protein LBU51_01445 [Bacteroidales bacterium]|nr:hypothetical protein [Bacteroidales bacterium]
MKKIAPNEQRYLHKGLLIRTNKNKNMTETIILESEKFRFKSSDCSFADSISPENGIIIIGSNAKYFK